MEIITPTPKGFFQGKWCVIIKASDRDHIDSEHFINMSSLPPASYYCIGSSPEMKQELWLWKTKQKQNNIVILWEHIILSFYIQHCAYKDFLTSLRSQTSKIIHLNSISVFVALGNFDVIWLSTLEWNYKFKYDNFPWSLWNVTS